MASTGFVAIIIRLYGTFLTPKLRSLQTEILAPGLPSPYLLMVSDTGDIAEYSYVEKKFNLNGLPNLKTLPHKPYKNIYVLHHQGALYFLSTDEKQNVVKYDIIGKTKSQIPDSKFPITGLNRKENCGIYGCLRTYGAHIMDHYWIILGEKYGGLSRETCLWSVKKEQWIKGPNLQGSGVTNHFHETLGYKDNEICFVGVGNGEAYILIEIRLVLGYNFYKNQWKNGILPPSNFGVAYTLKVNQNSCVFYQNKNYER
jgi:hypothetical protein